MVGFSVAAPEEQSGADGLGDAGLVAGIGDRGGGQGRELKEDGGAGEVIERPNEGAAGVIGEASVGEGGGELCGEALRLLESGGLRGGPGDGSRRRRDWRVEAGNGGFKAAGRGLWRADGGGDDVDAGAGVGGVKDDAGEGMDVVGEAGALVWRGIGLRWGEWGGLWCGGRLLSGGWGGGCLGFAAEEGGDAERGELEADAIGEARGDVFFEELLAGVGGKVSSGVVAAVGGIEEDEGVVQGLSQCWDGGGYRGWAAGGWRRSLCVSRQGEGEQREMGAETGHFKC